MFATSRAVYSKLVGVSRDDCTPHADPSSGKLAVATLKELAAKYASIRVHSGVRRLFRKAKSRARHTAVHNEVRDSAFADFMKAVKSSRAIFFADRARGKFTEYPELTFKNKFARSDSIMIQARMISVFQSNVCFHPTFFGFKKGEGIEVRELVPEIEYSCRLLRHQGGYFYLSIARHKQWQQLTTQRVCAIAPGVRNFATIFDPDGRTVNVTDSTAAHRRRFEAIYQCKSRLAAYDNACKSRLSLEPKVRTKERQRQTRARRGVQAIDVADDGDSALLAARRKRYRLRRRIRFTNRRVMRLVEDMHNNVASWIASSYRYVLLPTFQTSEMVRLHQEEAKTDGAPATALDEAVALGRHGAASWRGHREIRSPTARAMLALVHYKFRMLLSCKMARVGGAVIECGEVKSKTCSQCGAQNHTIGASTAFNCSSCGAHADCDVNAARNIYIKNRLMLPM